MRASVRAQYIAARLTDYLPPKLQLRLAGEEPLVADGLRFDAHAQLLRSVRKRRHNYRLTEPTIEAARKRYRFETSAFRGPVTKVRSVTDLRIGDLAARRYEPESPSQDVLLYFHGGGFVIGDLDTHDEPCRTLCHHAGVQVISVAYRRAPEHKFPAAVDDARAALAWAVERFPRVSVGGDSAGGNLATVVARGGAYAQLLIYPVTDYRTDRPSQRLFGDGHFLTSIDREAFRRYYVEGTGVAQDDPRVSPIYGDLRDMPRALVVTAGFDLLRDEGEEYAQKLNAELLRVESLGHGFIHLTGVCRTARNAMIDVARRFRALLAR